MKKIEAIIFREHIDLVTEALNDELRINGITATEVSDIRTRESADPHYTPPPRPRAKIELVVNDDKVVEIIRVLLRKIPKGKQEAFSSKPAYDKEIIHVSPVENVVRIRTEESGDTAI